MLQKLVNFKISRKNKEKDEFESFTSHSKKIFATSVNYKSTANSDDIPIPNEPIFFRKPTSIFITQGQNIILSRNSNIIHEVELGVIIGKHCHKVTKALAPSHIAGYCLALNLVDDRKMQSIRGRCLPWTLDQGITPPCPVSNYVKRSKVRNPQKLDIWCKVNGKMKQKSSTKEMIFKVNELISFISQTVALEPFDLILTGTPCGSGPLKPNDVVECGLGNILQMQFLVKEALGIEHK